jgi:hypothetical protein
LTKTRSLALAGLLGVVAIAIGWFLLSQGRSADRIPGVAYKARYIDAGPMLHLVDVLSSDALEGRASGTPGNEAARGFIRKRFEDVGLIPLLSTGWEQPVTILPSKGIGGPAPGANVMGWVPGITPGQGPLIVITAHYDHLGILNGEIYNGADDNASGVGALTALAGYFVRQPAAHDLVFVALDAEEIGFLGARAFLRDLPFAPERLALNINFDMISRSAAGELYVAGTYHTPELAGLVTAVAEQAPITLLKGHDRPQDGPDDWTMQSDHAEFHKAGIPFLYFGVEDHPGYHKPTDDFSAITPDFYIRAADTLVDIVRAADTSLMAISALRRGPVTEKSTEETSQ